MNVSGSDRVAAVAVIDMNKDFSAIETLPTGAALGVIEDGATTVRAPGSADGNGAAPQARAEDEDDEEEEEEPEDAEEEDEGEETPE
jgi:hypothetical protein